MADVPAGYCPVLDEPCACKSLGRAFCKEMAAAEAQADKDDARKLY